jgi:hypothetical protein
MGEVLHHDHGGIHQEAHGDGEAAQGHGVEAEPREMQRNGGAEGGQGQHREHQQGPADIAQQDDQHQRHEDAAHQERQGDAIEGMGHQAALVVDHFQMHALGQLAFQFGHSGAHPFGHILGGGGRLLHDAEGDILMGPIPGSHPSGGIAVGDTVALRSIDQTLSRSPTRFWLVAMEPPCSGLMLGIGGASLNACVIFGDAVGLRFCSGRVGADGVAG